MRFVVVVFDSCTLFVELGCIVYVVEMVGI